jgi:hypothetical protein
MAMVQASKETVKNLTARHLLEQIATQRTIQLHMYIHFNANSTKDPAFHEGGHSGVCTHSSAHARGMRTATYTRSVTAELEGLAATN